MTRRFPLAILAMLACLPPAAWARKHETWFEARSPNFIVVSNAGEKQARKTAIEFEQVRTLFRQSLAVASGHNGPVITILAVRDEDSLRELMPEYWEKGHTRLAGYFVTRINQFFMAVDLEAGGANPYKTLYHEYYHSLTTPYFTNLPTWVAEGLADFFGNTTITDKAAKMGQPDADLIEELRENRLIPLDVLFRVDHTSPYYNEEKKTTVFYAESWALIHYLMIGDQQAHRQLLIRYLGALHEGATPERAAGEAFGDLKKLQDQLTRYIEKYAFYYVQTSAPPKIPESEIQSRNLSDAEADAIRGSFEAVRGKTQEAMRLLEEAVRLDPRLAVAQENLALAEFWSGQRAEALTSASRAIELDPKNGTTRYIRAYLSFSGGGMAPKDSQIEEDLRQAIELSPEFAPPCALLAVYLAARGGSLPEALTLAQKALALEPGNGSYDLALAQVLARMRRFDKARTAAVQARADASGSQERAQAEKFLTYLDQARDFESRTLSHENATASPDAASTRDESGREDSHREENLREATGVVTQVSCAGGLQLEMSTPSGTVDLRTQPMTGLKIQLQSKPPANFNPCVSLRGQRVEAEYEPDDATGRKGTLKKLRILALEGGGSVEGPMAGKPDISGTGAAPKAAAGTEITSEGTVGDVVCTGNEMQVKFSAANSHITLHARDTTRIRVELDVPFDAGEFQPCTHLSGRAARITYVVAEHKRYDGEIQAIEVEK